MSDATHGPLWGVVLAGGRSSRLGQDKARIVVDGRDLLARAVDLLASVVGEVWVMGRDPAQHGLALPWRSDDITGLGPLGGILTSLRANPNPCLVISCDLPFLDRETLTRLVEARQARIAAQNDHPHLWMTTYRQLETGFIESLVAVYEPAVLPRLETAAARGHNKLSRAIPEEHRCHIPYTQDEALPFFNINYPADLALMRRMHALVAEPARA